MSQEKKGIPDNIDDKLSLIKYKTDKKSHLRVDQDICNKCKSKCCTHICPADVYNWSEEKNTLEIRYENCLECGACRICCPHKCIDWQYPDGGVTFKQG